MFSEWSHVLPSQSEKDSKEEILKAFRLFDDDETVRDSCCMYHSPQHLLIRIGKDFI